jgi:hypothetical protein
MGMLVGILTQQKALPKFVLVEPAYYNLSCFGRTLNGMLSYPNSMHNIVDFSEMWANPRLMPGEMGPHFCKAQLLRPFTYFKSHKLSSSFAH